MSGSDAALVARFVRVAATVLDAPMAALFRFEGDKAVLVERVVRLERSSEITQLSLPAARLKLTERRVWSAAHRTRPPTELVAFPASTRLAWVVSVPLFASGPTVGELREPIGLLVVADVRPRPDDEHALSGLEDVRSLLEDKMQQARAAMSPPPARPPSPLPSPPPAGFASRTTPTPHSSPTLPPPPDRVLTDRTLLQRAPSPRPGSPVPGAHTTPHGISAPREPGVRERGDRTDPFEHVSPTPALGTPRRPVVSRDAGSREASGQVGHGREESSSERRIPHDPVTGLPDRASMLEEAGRRIERAHVLQLRIALVLVALDRFRRVNETLGQTVGDAILRQVGARLRESVGDADLVGRRAGDEFLLVVEDDGAVLALADRVQQGFREPFYTHGHELSLSASLAVVRHPGDVPDLQTLLRCADIALAHAKQAGRGKLVVFDAAMQEAVNVRAEVERDLRVALRDGQLLLHYQPKFRVRDRALIGAEALLRWRHPQKGLVSPARFIPVAEDTGLIVPIGTWALNEVARQRTAWAREGADVGRVSVNVSALQFARPDFVGTVTRAMRGAGTEPGQLELELTESIVMDDVEHVATRLRELRKLGVAVSIDDFGTGYSSLAYLQNLPMDVLKIDRSFVRPLDQTGDAQRGAHALVGAITTLAHGLGLHVIAEGVETEGQFAALAQLGCDEIQGFLLGKPMPAPELADLARRSTL